MSKINTTQLHHAARVAEEAVQSGTHTCALIAVANSREMVWTHLLPGPDMVWTHLVPGPDEVGEDSIFLLASITKPIVATAIMQLVEQGRLSLTTPVATYLPEFGANGKEGITAYHLLTHTSGIGDEEQFWDELAEMREMPPPCYLFNACCRSNLIFEPGTQCLYNSLTFSVLGELISRLGGLPYPEYLRMRIFEPLGMSSSGFQPPDPRRAAPVHGFASPEQMYGFMTLAVPGGGLWGTASDLIAFGQTFLRGGSRDGKRLLSPASIATMTRHYTQGKTQMVNGQPAPFNYGLGWAKPASPPNGGILTSERAYGHGGATGTLLWIDPEYDLVYVFLANQWGITSDCA